ncbi:hypothetical protein D3C80_1747740 [compost metagenome]
MEAVANCSTTSEKLPLAAPLPRVMVATFSSEEVPLRPLKLLLVTMDANPPRKASSAA